MKEVRTQKIPCGSALVFETASGFVVFEAEPASEKEKPRPILDPPIFTPPGVDYLAVFEVGEGQLGVLATPETLRQRAGDTPGVELLFESRE